MSSLDHSPVTIGTIMKVVGDTTLATTAKITIGGAGAVTEVPSGMKLLLGIYAHLYSAGPTNDQAISAWGFLDTEDGFNIKPFEFLFPNVGCAGGPMASDTGTGTNSIPGIFYPINCPVVPGGRISAHAQAYETNTIEPFVAITYLFGKNLVLPKSMDDHPGWHRWRKVQHTEVATVAAGYAPEAQYQFTLSARGGAITEVGALIWTETQDPTGCGGGATMQINSVDVPVMPMEFNTNAFSQVLSAQPAHDGSYGVTRMPCSAFGERVVHLDPQLRKDGGSPITTGRFVSMVEFVRRGERGPPIRG